MEVQATNEFAIPTQLLPLGVVACKSIPHTSWNTKCIILTNEASKMWPKPSIIASMLTLSSIQKEKSLARKSSQFKLQNSNAKLMFCLLGCGQCTLGPSSTCFSLAIVCMIITRLTSTTRWSMHRGNALE